VIEALVRCEEDLTTTALEQQVQYSTTTLRRALEDLQSLELVACESRGSGRPSLWRLRDAWRPLVKTFSAEYGSPSAFLMAGAERDSDEHQKQF
jgi:predicted ArsR family transcriptional regulator